MVERLGRRGGGRPFLSSILARAAALLGGAAASLAAGGPPAEPGPFREPDLVEVIALDPTIRLDVRYATADNLAGRPVYAEPRAFLQRPAAEALARAHRALKEQGYGLVVFDGYRPWSVTKLLWDSTPPDKRTFVADPAEGSKHNRGCAVDLTLYDLATGREVTMPGAYDEMTERSYVTYAGGPATARDHRDRLRRAMEREGFFVHPFEWWHFDYKDWREYPILDVAFAGVQPAAPFGSAAPGRPPDLSSSRLVDLTHAFDETTLYWPNLPSGFRLTRLSHGWTPGGYFYAANTFCAPEHGGTHLDAPIHFAEGRRTVDAIPLERLLGPAVVIDVASQAARDADYRLTAEDVRKWEAAHGTIPRGAIVLLRTGWASRWPDRRRYLGDDTPGETRNLHFPSYGKEAAELLVRDRAVAALGVDTASIDHGPSGDFAVHQAAHGADVPGLENLANLEALPERGAWIIALPMKIAGGSGAPVRAVALVPR